MKALIDGDVIVYQAGFASDQTSYTCPDVFNFQYKKDAVAHCNEKGLIIANIDKHVVAEPVEFCLSSVKKMIKGMMKKIDANEYAIFLTGKGNFREKIFTDYKANRDRSHRPIHYEAIREYLLTVWKADEVIGVEADDAMGWAQWKDLQVTGNDQLSGESCICTIDKDLNQIPGWHFNWQLDGGEGMMYWVDPEQANRYFFEQWLMGDAADNIPGITKVGAVTANNLLNMLEDKVHPKLPTAKQYYEYVTDLWTARMPSTAPSMVHIIGDLLWMQRAPGEMWHEHLELAAERRTHEA